MIHVVGVFPGASPAIRRFRIEGGEWEDPVHHTKGDAVPSGSLPEALFRLDTVLAVGMAGRIISVENSSPGSWERMEPEIAFLIEEHADPPSAVENDVQRNAKSLGLPEDFFALAREAMLAHAERILDLEVRPFLASDGGNVKLIGIKGKTILVRYLGACGECPTSSGPTLEFLRAAFKSWAHPSAEVRAVSGDTE